MKNELTLVVVLVMGTSSAKALQAISFDFDDWPNTVAFSFEEANVDSNSFLEIETGGYKAVGYVTAEATPVSLNIGVSSSEPGAVVGNLLYSFHQDGSFNQSSTHLPPGWSAEPTFAYNPETFSGSLSWALSFTEPPPPVPDMPATAGMLALGALGLAAMRKIGAPVAA